MENKINVAELLLNCPTGMELDCTMYEGVTFVSLDHTNYEYYPIKIKTRSGIEIKLTRYGQNALHEDAKCVIFPKGKTSWEDFVPPCHNFKDGDICYIKTENSESVFIFQGLNEHVFIKRYVNLRGNSLLTDNGTVCQITSTKEFRFATKEEKEKLFRAIKDSGYRWNSETKTLEKLFIPKFKEGDRIVLKDNPHKMPSLRIKAVTDTLYILEEGVFYITSTDERYVLKDKFEINDLKTFDKVLVRTKGFTPAWTIDFYAGYRPEIGGSFRPFAVSGGGYFQQCIPYEGNEHLLGTTDDCDEFYKIWED